LARSTIIVTVDVESTTGLTLPQEIDAVCMDGSRCGLMEIVRLLQERQLAATFFLDVYEYKKYGVAPLRSIAVALRDSHQDVALHTHPQWVYDPSQPYMYSYSLERQIRIVRDGMQLLEEWTGLPVVAHRAGAYSADRNTLEALTRNGIRIDCSLFFRNPQSRLNGLGLPNNVPSIVGGITEIPVSVYQRDEHPAGLVGWAPPFSSIRKIDVNSLIDEREARLALTAAVNADFPYVLVFLHSFSLIGKPGVGGAGPAADRKARRVFETLLSEIAAARYPTTTVSALASRFDIVIPGRRDGLPHVMVTVPAWKYLWHTLHARFAAPLLAVAGVMFAALVAFGAVWVISRNKRPVP
jgi:peptidoglycan/xylan/chitin deacetylase (PgdA/CDA1 family)